MALEWRAVRASPMKKGESSLGTTGAETVDLLPGQVGMSGVRAVWHTHSAPHTSRGYPGGHPGARPLAV